LIFVAEMGNLFLLRERVMEREITILLVDDEAAISGKCIQVISNSWNRQIGFPGKIALRPLRRLDSSARS